MPGPGLIRDAEGARYVRDRYLHHVTLASGQVRRSPRSEVGDHIVALLQPLLDRALTGEHVPIPGKPGYTMTGGVQGRCCMVTLWRAMGDTGGPEPDRIPVLSVGVASHSRCGAQLWRTLHDREDLPYRTRPDQVPPEPWCADRLDMGAVLAPGELDWTGDWSRCVAWAWLERRPATRPRA